MISPIAAAVFASGEIAHPYLERIDSLYNFNCYRLLA